MLKLLIVDEDSTRRGLMSKLLSHHYGSIKVIAVKDHRSAMPKLVGFDPDLIIVGIRSSVSEVKRIAKRTNAPVIAIIRKLSETFHAMNAGATDCVLNKHIAQGEPEALCGRVRVVNFNRVSRNTVAHTLINEFKMIERDSRDIDAILDSTARRLADDG